MSQANELGQLKPQLDAMGVQLVAVGLGSPEAAAAFKTASQFPGVVLCDTEAKVFAALTLRRMTTWEALKRFVFSFAVLGAFKRANSQFANDSRFDSTGSNQGTQTGGVFVVGPAAAPDFSYAFVESDHDADAEADKSAIIKACSPLSGPAL